MGKKKNAALLEEGTVRQFMKLANLKPLAEGFITEAYEDEAMDEQDEDFAPAVSDDSPMMGDEEMEMGMEPEGDPSEVSLTDEEAGVLIGLGDKLAASGAGEADMDDMDDMDDMAPDADMGMDMGMPPEDDEEVVEGVSVVDEDAIMKETFKRVARRLSAMKREEKLVEAITSRVEQNLKRGR